MCAQNANAVVENALINLKQYKKLRFGKNSWNWIHWRESLEWLKKKKIGGQVGERNNILTLSLKENASNKRT